MKTLLVTGGAGLLGQWVVRKAAGFEVHYTYRNTLPPTDLVGTAHQLDLLDEAAVLDCFAAIKPDYVIHTAVSMAKVADIPEQVRNLCAGVKLTNARLVALSTDALLDGTGAPYPDNTPPSPISAYGDAKTAAEAVIAAQVPSAAIPRTSLIFSLNPIDHQTRWLIDGLSAGKPVSLFTDEYRCPIWVENLAELVIELAQTDYAGLLNLCGGTQLSRWDYGNLVLDLAGFTQRDTLHAVTIAESGLRRAPNLTLDLTQARQTLRTPILGVDNLPSEDR